MGLGKARIPTDKSYQTRPNSTKLDQTRHQSLRLSNPQSAIRTRRAGAQRRRNPQLTTPQRVVVAAQAATNLGTKTAPIFAVSFYGSVDFQPLTEIREPPAVPCALAFSSVQSSRFKVQGSKFKVQSSRFKVQSSRFKVQGSKFKVPRLHFVPARSRRLVPPKPGGGGSSERRRKGSALLALPPVAVRRVPEGR